MISKNIIIPDDYFNLYIEREEKDAFNLSLIDILNSNPLKKIDWL